MEYEKPILAIRTDASTQLGLGHLIRCISLAGYLKDDYKIKFFCRQIPLSLEQQLDLYHFDLYKIKEESEFLHSLGAGVTSILDGINFGLDYQKKIKENGANLVCIDDLAQGEFAVDLIINQSPGVQKSDYNTISKTQFALGPEYALLRSSFFRDDAEFSESNLRKNLLICFGGSDVQNLTVKVLKIALSFKEFDKITIITGSAYTQEDMLNSMIKKCGICDYYHDVGEQKMAELMFEADAAVVPASGILFEAMATKNVVISGMYIDNQKNNYTAFRDRCAFIDAGRFSRNEIESALSHIKEFKPAEIIDGKSPDRLKKIFKKLSLQN